MIHLRRDNYSAINAVMREETQRRNCIGIIAGLVNSTLLRIMPKQMRIIQCVNEQYEQYENMRYAILMKIIEINFRQAFLLILDIFMN